MCDQMCVCERVCVCLYVCMCVCAGMCINVYWHTGMPRIKQFSAACVRLK